TSTPAKVTRFKGHFMCKLLRIRPVLSAGWPERLEIPISSHRGNGTQNALFIGRATTNRSPGDTAIPEPKKKRQREQRRMIRVDSSDH
ncbi:MAG: hypothetical protein WA826_02685, partial [Silvibacterium sp.]